MNDKSKANPLRIGDFMTKAPCLVDEGLTVADAQQRMYVNNIRHLGVMRDNRVLVGVVSSRDLSVAAAVTGKDPEKFPIAEAMMEHPFTCTADSSLEEVVYEMECHRYGCAIVLEGLRPVGVFTTIDALRALRQLLAGRPVEAASPAQHTNERPRERQHVELHVHAGDKLGSRRGASPSPNQGKISF